MANETEPIPEVHLYMISEILKKYETDKQTHSTADGHSYGESYDEILGWFPKDEALNILEVGTQKGGSLLAWQEYFPNAKVTGVDIVDMVKPEYRQDTINYVISDVKEYQTDEMFDLIIDDGSHFLPDVLHVVQNLLPNLKPNGVMVIEDVQNAQVWIHEVKKYIGERSLEVRDIRHTGRYDDFLIIIK